MKEFSTILSMFKSHLELLTEPLIIELINIFSKDRLVYQQGMTSSDVAAYFFEYDYDDFDIRLCPSDRALNTVAYPITLLQDFGKINNKSIFLPEVIFITKSLYKF